MVFRKTFVVAVLVLILLLTSVAFADQAMWITKAQAEQAVAVLRGQPNIKHFCAPAGDTEARTEAVNKVTMEQQDQDYWTVRVNGEEIDLAYVYVLEGGKWTNLAMKLEIEVFDVPETIK